MNVNDLETIFDHENERVCVKTNSFDFGKPRSFYMLQLNELFKWIVSLSNQKRNWVVSLDY